MVKTSRTIVNEIKYSLRSRTGQLAANVMQHNALLKKLEADWAKRPKPKPLTAAEKREAKRRETLGRKYLEMAHDLGVYDDDDDY